MTFYPGIPDLRLGTHSPQPIAKGGGLGELVYPEYSTQGVILLNMADIIQAKAAFMLHQHQRLDEHRGLIAPVTAGCWNVVINALIEVQGVYHLSNRQQNGTGA